MKSKHIRRVLTVGAALALTATVAAAANATVLDPVGQRQGSLASFGPLMDNGFPTSYKDTHAVRLEACITGDDPLCAAAAGDTYDPAQPLSFPDNFPDEFFYQLASAVIPVNPANAAEKLLVESNIEGAFAAGAPAAGDQMVFARVRIRDKDVPNGTTWRITHPYGVDVLTAGDKGINSTVDVGVAPGKFSGALAGRVGPFLKWDPSVAPAAPAGHIGDPGVLHKVVGSPYDTNYVKVEQKNADGSWSLIGQWDDQFSLQGRLAVEQRRRRGRRLLHRRRQRRLPGRLRVLRRRAVDRGERERRAGHARDPDARGRRPLLRPDRGEQEDPGRDADRGRQHRRQAGREEDVHDHRPGRRHVRDVQRRQRDSSPSRPRPATSSPGRTRPP